MGKTRSKHAGVIGAFGKKVVKEEGLQPEIGAALAALFQLRLEADYGHGTLTAVDAEYAIADAKRVVDSVDAWLAGRSSR